MNYDRGGVVTNTLILSNPFSRGVLKRQGNVMTTKALVLCPRKTIWFVDFDPENILI